MVRPVPRRPRQFARLPETNPFMTIVCWYRRWYPSEILMLESEQNQPSDRKFDSVPGTIFFNVLSMSGLASKDPGTQGDTFA
jgi:hypothetical protein